MKINMANDNSLTFLQGIRKIDWEVPIIAITQVDKLSVLPQVIKFKISNFILGSTAAYIVNHANVPVLVVP